MDDARSRINSILGYVITVSCLIGISLQIRRVADYENSLAGMLMVSTFFTNHANLFVLISTVLILLNINSKHMDRFAFITTIDITITCIVFFTLLLPFMDNVTFLQILLHGIIPPLYITYYLRSRPTSLNLRSTWISMIHPFIYFLFVQLIVHQLYGEYLHDLFPNEVDPYVYPFLNPVYYNHGFLGMILVNLLVLFPIAVSLSTVILLCKKRLEIEK